MVDLNQQADFITKQSQKPSRFALIPVDSYTLLLVVGLIVLFISFAGLTFFWLNYYGGLAPKPVFGKVTAVSQRSIRIDIGSNQGLSKDSELLVLRRGAFLADLSVLSTEPDTAAAVAEENMADLIASGDTVVFSPLGQP